jgi:hypothetical protein
MLDFGWMKMKENKLIIDESYTFALEVMRLARMMRVALRIYNYE